MTTFYLNQLNDTSGSKKVLLSQQTIVLCKAGLIGAEWRSNWVQDLEPLDDAEWETAQTAVQTAIDELNAAGIGVDGGSA